MKKEKSLSNTEILQSLYDKGLIDFTGEESLNLHIDTTINGILEIFKAGYKKSEDKNKQFIKEILNEIDSELKIIENKDNIESRQTKIILNLVKQTIKQKAGFRGLE